MFNLEQAIADWQQQMLVAGIKSPTPLDELEIHLREEIERQMKSGLGAQPAFAISVQRIGQPQKLDTEFTKIERTFEFNFVVRQNMHLISNSLHEIRHFCFDANPYPTGRRGLRRNRNVWRAVSSDLSHYKLEFTTSMKRIFKIVAAFLLGLAIQLPGSFQLRDDLVMADGRLVLWLLGFILQMWAISSLWRVLRPGTAKIEFEKFELSLPQLAKTSVGAVVLLGGVALAIPAALQARYNGRVTFDALCWLTFGFALLVMGALVTFCPYKKQKA